MELVKKEAEYLEAIKLERELINHESVWLQNFTSEQTKRTYSLAFREFCNLHQVGSPEAFRSMTEAEVIQYRDYLIKSKEMSNRSVKNRLSALSSCFNYLRQKGVVKINPTEGVERPKVDERSGETPAMSNSQVRLLLSQPDTRNLKGKRDSAILHFLFYTGARIGAPGTIKIKDYYQDKGFYILKWKTKGGKNQKTPVNSQLQSALLLYLSVAEHKHDPEAPLFAALKAGNNKGKGLTRDRFYQVWDFYRKKAGLPAEFTPHSARATFATVADENGAPIQDIQVGLGHANISTTQPYIHSRKGYKDSVVNLVNYTK